MSKGRYKDADWNLADVNGNIGTWEKVTIAVLMDIRDELKQLNALIGCYNFKRLPQILDRIDANTKKRKYTRKAVAA